MRYKQDKEEVVFMMNYIILSAALIFIIYLDLVKVNFKPVRQRVRVDNRSFSERLLDERYARGEINSYEYQKRKSFYR